MTDIRLWCTCWRLWGLLIIPTINRCTRNLHSLDLPFPGKGFSPSHHHHGQKFIWSLMAKVLQWKVVLHKVFKRQKPESVYRKLSSFLFLLWGIIPQIVRKSTLKEVFCGSAVAYFSWLGVLQPHDSSCFAFLDADNLIAMWKPCSVGCAINELT